MPSPRNNRAAECVVSRVWDGGRFTLTQTFVINDVVDGPALLRLIDVEIRAQGTRGCLRVVRAHGDHVYTVLGIPLVRLGAAQGNGVLGLRREIQGGALAHRGGSLEMRIVPEPEPGTAVISLVRFRPRLPRWLYALTQARLHERLVRQAVAHVLAGTVPTRPVDDRPPPTVEYRL